MGRHGRRTLLAAICLAIGVAMPPAFAQESLTRDEYVPRLEQVCKPRAEATRRAMRGVRDDVRADRLVVASRKFARGAKIFGGTVRKISRVPRPPADRGRLSKWFKYLKAQESYLERISVQLRRHRAVKAQRLLARFIHNGNMANNVTLAFGFNWCRFKFSRYG